MIQEKKLKEYCKLKMLDYEIEDGILVLDGVEYEIVDSSEQVFDEDLNVIVNMTYDIDKIVFFFGGRWYLQDINEEVNFKECINIGKAVQKLSTPSSLCIHSGYELMNGIGLYSTYINKAKFLGIETLGICEKNTLGGVLTFQEECIKADIKPITGMSVQIKGEELYDIKLYVKNFQGWLDLLKINKIINVDLNTYITIDQIKEYSKDLFVILDPKTMSFKKEDTSFGDFFQLDTVEFKNDDLDKEYLNNLEQFIKSGINPISIFDVYCLEQEEVQTRELLWTIGKAFDLRTSNQYFKNRDQYAKELIIMFKQGNTSWVRLFNEAIDNEKKLVDECNFIYDTDTRHLPNYIMTDEEKDQFDTNYDLFIHLIKKGFKDRNITDTKKYMDRLKVEIDVLKFANVIDYFLSLYDIIKFAEKEDILVGLARGSAGGSLVAYLLGIIKIDPMEFDLLFERFLNVGRAGNYEDRPLYIFTMDDSTELRLPEGTLVRINRDGRETADLVDKLQEGDEILRY